jgi:hypothetical protein
VIPPRTNRSVPRDNAARHLIENFFAKRTRLATSRVVSLLGSLSDVLLVRYAPRAQVVGAKAGDDAILLMQAGRADCIIYALIQALGVSAKAPMLEQVTLLEGPLVALPSAMGVQIEPDRRWRDFLDSWTDYNTGHPPGRRLDAPVASGDGGETGKRSGERRPLTQ